MTHNDPFIQFVSEVRGALDYWREYTQEEEPEAPPASLRKRSKLHWVESQSSTITAEREYMSLEDGRRYIGNRMQSYADESRPNRLLLVKAPPGLGKTWSAIHTAQESAGRVLYSMPTHAHWETLVAMPPYMPELWYHWLAYSAEQPDALGEKMCRYANHATAWMRKGYPLDHMCQSLCAFYKSSCAYRQQADVTQKVIAGVHEHMVTGLAISDFKLAIIDEEPTRAFLKPRRVKASDLPGYSSMPIIGEFMTVVKNIAEGDIVLDGPELLGKIAPILSDLYAMIEDAEIVPEPPVLNQPADIKHAPSWVLTDIAKLLVPEWMAYKSHPGGEWLTRIRAGAGHLDLLARNHAWKQLPARTIVLDATAALGHYQRLLPGRNIDVVDIVIKSVGRIHQVTGRYNGISQMTVRDRSAATEYAIQALEACQKLANSNGMTNPGAVTFKAATPAFAAVFGSDNVAHFYGQRGSNALEHCDGGFVIGSPSPSDQSTVEAATIINDKRIRPFKAETLGAYLKPLRSDRLVTYSYAKGEGLVPQRWLSGLWHDPDLSALAHSRREQELVQAVHRFRPLHRNVDVYVLSSVPLPGVALASIHDTPPIGTPPGIPWTKWLALSRWLDSQDEIDYEMLANYLNMSTDYLKSQKWLDTIADSLDGWSVASLWRPGKGRKPKGLVRN